jgi:hypothetical protein
MVSDAQIKTSGTEVFNGNWLNLNATSIDWQMKRNVSTPVKPGNWSSYAEQDSTGFVNPTISIDGIYDASVSHGTNETGSNIDFQFLNELHVASGLKYLKDEYFTDTTGSPFLVEITKIATEQTASRQPGNSERSPVTQYAIQLVIVSGTPPWSGTGIV